MSKGRREREQREQAFQLKNSLVSAAVGAFLTAVIGSAAYLFSWYTGDAKKDPVIHIYPVIEVPAKKP